MQEATRADMEQHRVSERHVYFRPEGKIIELGSGPYVPLQPRNYGSLERTVVLPRHDYGFLSPRQAAHLDHYFDQPIHLMLLLNAIPFCVNDSMQYDISKAGKILAQRRDKLVEELKAEGKLTPPMKRKIARRLHTIMTCQDNQLTVGDEAFKGICYDAGSCIRQILATIEPYQDVQNPENDSIRFMQVLTNPDIEVPLDEHDTTAVFDIATGDWVVLNPTHWGVTEGLVDRDEYKRLGTPFGNGRIYRI